MSSDNNNRLELSRRKILGSVGAVGAAGAAAGLGTSALFSDEESFENNSITAGELDLKVDWEEHYSYPQIYDGFDDPLSGDGVNASRESPDDVAAAVRRWVNNPALATEMGDKARDVFEASFSKDVAVDQYYELIRSI